MKNKSIKKIIYDKCLNILYAGETREIDYNIEIQEGLISRISSKYFKQNELQYSFSSSLEILIRRSIAQYCGSKYWNPSVFNVILRYTACLFILPLYIVYLYSKSIKFQNRGVVTPEQFDNILISETSSNIFMNFFYKIYPERSMVINGSLQQLRFRDIMFVIEIVKRCRNILLYPELILRSIRRIAQYSSTIERYNCKIIVAISSEGSPWSSILTAYCRSEGVRHVQIMHGIRFYSSQMAFAEFDDYYVWGEYHCDVFKKMNVNAQKFIVAGNPTHQIMYSECKRINQSKTRHVALICFDYPIMMLDDMFSLVHEVTEKVLRKGWDVVFRSHPSYIKESLEYFKKLQYYYPNKINSEDPLIINLIDSFKKAEVVVSCYSNALTDAWIAGKKCIYINNDRIPLQEFHFAKNIKIFHKGDDISSFLVSPLINDDKEHVLKNRFSYNYNLISLSKETNYEEQGQGDVKFDDTKD